MEYLKMISLLVNTPTQPSKFRTKSWVEINDDARGTYLKLDLKRTLNLKLQC